MIARICIQLFDSPSDADVALAELTEEAGVDVEIEPFAELDVVTEGPDPTFPLGAVRAHIMNGVSTLLDQAHDEVEKLGRGGGEAGLVVPKKTIIRPGE